MNIALVGKMYSGKTTLADMLVEHYGYTRMSLAAPVKEISAAMCEAALDYMLDRGMFGLANVGIDVKDIEDNKATFRPLLQWVGTEFFREYLGYQSIWIDLLLARVERSQTPVVVDDVRFLNEALALSSAADFRVIRLERIGGPHATGSVSLHPSEIELDSIVPDLTVQARDLDRLRQIADAIGRGEPL